MLQVNGSACFLLPREPGLPKSKIADLQQNACNPRPGSLSDSSFKASIFGCPKTLLCAAAITKLPDREHMSVGFSKLQQVLETQFRHLGPLGREEYSLMADIRIPTYLKQKFMKVLGH